MDFTQFLGFLVTLAAMIFLVVRRAMEERQRRKNPEVYQAEKRKQEETLKKFLKSLDVDIEEEEEEEPPPLPRAAPPPPPPQLKAKPAPHRLVRDEYKYTSKFEKYQPETAIGQRQFKTSIEGRNTEFNWDRVVSPDLRLEHDAYAHKEVVRAARGRRLLDQLHTKQDMVVLYEILNKPKGLN